MRTAWTRARQPASAGLVLLMVLAVFAPEPALPGSPLILAAERGPHVASFLVFDDLLLIEEAAGAGEPTVWSVHQLPTGDYLWTTSDWPIHASPHGPVLTSRPGRTGVARDRLTGERLWTMGRMGGIVERAGLLVQTDDPWADFSEVEGSAVPDARDMWHHHIAVIDDTTGAVVWSEVSDRGWKVGHGGESAVVLVDPDGTVHVRDLATGGLRGSAVLPEFDATRLQVTGETLVTTSELAMDRHLRAYTLDTLEPAWELVVALPVGGETLETSDYLQWTDSSHTTVLDYRDGRVLSAPGRRPGYTRLFGERVVFMDGMEHLREVVDRRTGGVMADLAGWRLVEPGTASPERLLLTRSLGAGTMLASLDLASGQQVHLGRQPVALQNCRPFDGGLVCLSNGGLRLWRWR